MTNINKSGGRMGVRHAHREMILDAPDKLISCAVLFLLQGARAGLNQDPKLIESEQLRK